MPCAATNVSVSVFKNCWSRLTSSQEQPEKRSLVNIDFRELSSGSAVLADLLSICGNSPSMQDKIFLILSSEKPPACASWYRESNSEIFLSILRSYSG